MLRFTSCTELRMPVEASRTMSIFTSAGRTPCSSPCDAAHAVDHRDGVLALRLDDVDRQRALAVDQRRVLLFLLAVLDLGDLRRGRPAGRRGARR